MTMVLSTRVDFPVHAFLPLFLQGLCGVLGIRPKLQLPPLPPAHPWGDADFQENFRRDQTTAGCPTRWTQPKANGWMHCQNSTGRGTQTHSSKSCCEQLDLAWAGLALFWPVLSAWQIFMSRKPYIFLKLMLMVFESISFLLLWKDFLDSVIWLKLMKSTYTKFWCCRSSK